MPRRSSVMLQNQLATYQMPARAVAELTTEAQDIYTDTLARTRDHGAALLAVYLSGAVQGHAALASLP